MHFSIKIDLIQISPNDCIQSVADNKVDLFDKSVEFSFQISDFR